MAITVQSVQLQRPRMHERESSLARTASAGAVEHNAAAQAAEPSPAEPPSAQHHIAGRDAQTALARLLAAPLLLHVSAAAVSTGCAVGRGRRSRATAELREAATPKIAADGSA